MVQGGPLDNDTNKAYTISQLGKWIQASASNRPFQSGLGRHATFLEDGGYTGIFSAMLNWICSGKSCEQNMELNSSYMVHERPAGLQHENKYLLITSTRLLEITGPGPLDLAP